MVIFVPMYAILDIESTGGPFGREAIMEIAVYRFDGQEVADQLISLVHPHRSIQKFVSKMTGITEKMLARAPRFHELAKRIIEITEDAVLVGHNVEFDYRMLRQEFARLGYEYERKTLDTIELAEELIPGLPSYGLDKVCEELGLFRTHKHRADSDARATLELFRILQEKDQRKKISILGQRVQKVDYQKHKVDDLLRSVKNNRGLFYLHDSDGNLLYLGASDNIRSAISRMLIAGNERAEELRQKVTTLRTEPAGNWLIARIKRAEELDRVEPPFNRGFDSTLDIGLYLDKRSRPPSLYFNDLDKAGNKKALVKALNRKSAGRALRMYKRMSDDRIRQGIIELLNNWPAEQIFVGRGRKNTERSALVVRGGELAGYFYFSLDDQVAHASRLEKSMTPLKASEVNTEMLKLGILSGEFKPLKAWKG